MQHVGLIGHCLRLSLWHRCERSGNGAERAKTRVERSGAVSGSQKNWAERSGAWAGGRGAGTERWAKVRKIRFNAERQNLPLRSAHMLWWWVATGWWVTLRQYLLLSYKLQVVSYTILIVILPVYVRVVNLEVIIIELCIVIYLSVVGKCSWFYVVRVSYSH